MLANNRSGSRGKQENILIKVNSDALGYKQGEEIPEMEQQGVSKWNAARAFLHFPPNA
jgi:hypothetical protein